MIAGRDPRSLGDAQPANAAEHGVMPVVERPGRGFGTPAIAIGAIAAAALLFVALDSHRRAASAPAVPPVARTDGATSTAPPPLYFPPAPAEIEPAPVYRPVPRIMLPPPAAAAMVPRAPPARLTMTAPLPPQVVFAPTQGQGYGPLPAPPAPPRAPGGAAVVFEAPRDANGIRGGGGAGDTTGAVAASGLARTSAGMFSNRSTTIPQGTLIPAVLETGFDSSRPGFARALVQRDIRGFDGSKVLVPRGSRLTGEYQADATTGQKRALITWTRLIRPDGATIALASPAADPVGRGGIRARVDTHFFERFSTALLRTALDIGTGIATRAANGPVVVALPGSFQNATTQIGQPERIKPTLSVRPATSVSVLVARDLDFTDIEGER